MDTAHKFYRYGMVLKQRANFYNNIATEMIPCQKPMLLKDAVEFEKARRGQAGAGQGSVSLQQLMTRFGWGKNMMGAPKCRLT